MKVSAADIAQRLHGKPEGGGYLCRCPVPTHGKRRGDRRPSLSVSDGRTGVVVHCFAGCRPADIFAHIDGHHRLTSGAPTPLEALPPPPGRTTSELARRLWRAGRPVAGTVAETYLRTRGFFEPPPPTIRFLPSYRFDRKSGLRLPCLMAAVQASSREIVAVQLTFLDPSGAGKADVPKPRRAIGPLGDGLLRTAPAARHLGLAEGFESAWAASLMHDRFPVWATLGQGRFEVIVLPKCVEQVTIFADHDAPCLASALRFFERTPGLDIDFCIPAAAGFDFANFWETGSMQPVEHCA